MSEYADIKTEFKSKDALLAALADLGLKPDQIEVHETPVNLIGYHGDIRPEVAHIIVRRKHVGSASNDIGFVRGADGKYTAIISAYDGRNTWTPAKQGLLKQHYAYHVIRLQQSRLGRTVSRTIDGKGRMLVTVGGVR